MDIAFIKCYIKSRFCIFCGLLHSGFAFSKTETWFWYSKIKIQPSQKKTRESFFYILDLNQGSTHRLIQNNNSRTALGSMKTRKYQTNWKRTARWSIGASIPSWNVKLVYINSAFWVYMRLSINNLCEIHGISVISSWYLCEIEKKVKRTYMYIGPKT